MGPREKKVLQGSNFLAGFSWLDCLWYFTYTRYQSEVPCSLKTRHHVNAKWCCFLGSFGCFGQMMQGCPPKKICTGMSETFISGNVESVVVIRFFFSSGIFLKFTIRLVVVKDSAVWSLNIFENFKKLVQKIQTNNPKQSSETQTWTEQCFIRSLKYKSVRKKFRSAERTLKNVIL